MSDLEFQFQIWFWWIPSYLTQSNCPSLSVAGSAPPPKKVLTAGHGDLMCRWHNSHVWLHHYWYLLGAVPYTFAYFCNGLGKWIRYDMLTYFDSRRNPQNVLPYEDTHHASYMHLLLSTQSRSLVVHIASYSSYAIHVFRLWFSIKFLEAPEEGETPLGVAVMMLDFLPFPVSTGKCSRCHKRRKLETVIILW